MIVTKKMKVYTSERKSSFGKGNLNNLVEFSVNFYERLKSGRRQKEGKCLLKDLLKRIRMTQEAHGESWVDRGRSPDRVQKSFYREQFQSH